MLQVSQHRDIVRGPSEKYINLDALLVSSERILIDDSLLRTATAANSYGKMTLLLKLRYTSQYDIFVMQLGSDLHLQGLTRLTKSYFTYFVLNL